MTAAKPPTRREVQIALGFTGALFFLFILLSAGLMDPRGFDFAGYYMGGLIIHQGNASKLYDLDEQARIERQLFHRDKILINPHPPFEALGFAFLARLPYVTAYVLWGAINVLLWLLSQNLFWRETPIPRNFIRYCFLPLLFFPLLFDLVIGQTTLLLLFLFSLAFVSLKRGQDFRAGVFLGLGLFRFPIVLPFALICFLRGKWRMMAGFAAAASFLGLLSIIAVGTAGIRAYVELLIDIMKNPNKPAYISLRAWKHMPTMRGFFSVLPAGRLAPLQMGVLAVATIALISFMAWRWRQADHFQAGHSIDLMFAAALTVSVVTAPHLYIYDLTMMLLPMFLVIGSPQWSRQSSDRRVLIAAMVILNTPPLYLLLLEWHAMYILAPVLVAFAFAAINLASKNILPAN
jgi:hypothetical protein